MEVFKILCFLSLSSAAISFQLTPPLNIKTPVGLDLGIGGIGTDLLNIINSKNNRLQPIKQCFCIPINANSRPVISHLDPNDKNIERKVVFLYKGNGVVKVYIPNQNKQELIPELNFDDSEGDILLPISTQSIVELFDPNIINSQQTIVTINGDILNESEPVDIETNEPQPIDTDSNQGLIENIDYPSVITTNDNTPLEEVIPIDEQNISIDNILNPSNEIQIEAINNPEVINISDADQLNPVSILPSNAQDVSSSVEVEELDIYSDLIDSDQVPVVTTILPPVSQPTDSQSNVVTIPSSEDYDQLPQIITEQPVQQNPWIQPIDTNINTYITFYDWFQAQLKHVVLFNLETSSKIVELRERIIKVLQDNGMRLSIKGVVTDSNGNLVRLNNIKLRPILIGTQIDPQEFLSHQANIAKIVPYVQFIEIILVTPPKLLGTLVLGTVYLPRSVTSGNYVNLWNNYQDGNIAHTNRPLGCVTCKPKSPHSPIHGLHYPTLSAAFGQYYELPFRRNFSTGRQSFKNELPYKAQAISLEEAQRQDRNDDDRKGIGGVFDNLLENIGIAPTLITNPTRRLLGGVLPKGPKPGPKIFTNDALPGFRIVGGNAATSSGTPLVNKGRSGFVKPSYII